MPSIQLSRSISIAKSPSEVFEAVRDFKTWSTWSPWLIVEPETKVDISADSRSVGSTYKWIGQITGQGEMTHRKIDPDRHLEIDLQFLKPFKSQAITSFQLEPRGDQTHVTWTMDTKLPWFLFWMVPMFKTFIGMDYSRGLGMLKALLETGKIPSTCRVHGVESIGPLRMAGIADTCSVFDIGSSMEKAMSTAEAEFQRYRLPTDGGMIAVYTKFRIKDGTFEYISGFLIPESVSLPPESQLTTWSLPAVKAFRVEHIGRYEHLGNGWSVANQLVQHRKHKQLRVGTFEIYRTTPPETPQEALQTDIYLPIRR